jgi:hypothetical protein
VRAPVRACGQSSRARAARQDCAFGSAAFSAVDINASAAAPAQGSGFNLEVQALLQLVQTSGEAAVRARLAVTLAQPMPLFIFGA